MLFRNWMGWGLGIAVGVFSVGNVFSEAKADHNRFRAPSHCAPSHHHGHGYRYGGQVISNRPMIVTPYAYGRPLGYGNYGNGNYGNGNYGSYYGNFNNGFNNSYYGNGFNGGNWPAGPCGSARPVWKVLAALAHQPIAARPARRRRPQPRTTATAPRRR